MADFAPAGRAHAARLADRIGREIIVEQEALLIGAFEPVDELLVLAGAERRDDQRLRLAAGEQRRAMRARQNADLRRRSAARSSRRVRRCGRRVENVPAHDLGLQIVEDLADLLLGELRLVALGSERREDLLLDGVDRLVALLLGGDLIGVAQFRFGDLVDRRLDRLLVGDGEIARLLGGAFRPAG